MQSECLLFVRNMLASKTPCCVGSTWMNLDLMCYHVAGSLNIVAQMEYYRCYCEMELDNMKNYSYDQFVNEEVLVDVFGFAELAREHDLAVADQEKGLDDLMVPL